MAAQSLRKLFVIPARLVVFVMETFAANRGRLKAFMAKPGVARGFQAVVLLTALAWLLIALFAPDHHGERLDNALEDLRSHLTMPAEPVSTRAAIP